MTAGQSVTEAPRLSQSARRKAARPPVDLGLAIALSAVESVFTGLFDWDRLDAEVFFIMF